SGLGPSSVRAAVQSRRRLAASRRAVGQGQCPEYGDAVRTVAGAGPVGWAGRRGEVRRDEVRGRAGRGPVRRRAPRRHECRLEPAGRTQGPRLRRPPRPGGLPETGSGGEGEGGEASREAVTEETPLADGHRCETVLKHDSRERKTSWRSWL